MTGLAGELLARGFVHVRDRIADRAAAWAVADEVFASAVEHDELGADMPPLEVVGEFTVPPVGAPHRDFQALHIDFGLPIAGGEAADVARFTALYVAPDRPPPTARTRIAPLAALLGQRSWGAPGAVLERWRRYGAGGVEGILGRLVEAADGRAELPSAAEPGFLCGMEFDSVAAERAHFARHGLELDEVEQHILIGPGELLLFDNLATAHGRIGARGACELNQRCVGWRALGGGEQEALLLRVAGAFAGRAAPVQPRSSRSTS